MRTFSQLSDDGDVMTTGQRAAAAISLLVAAAAGAVVFVQHRPARGAATASPAGSGSGASADRAVPVTTAKTVQKDVPVLVEGLGTVTPLMSVTVRPQVDGRLDSVLFKEGQPVKKGEVLALVDPRPFSIQLQQGEAAFARDQANLKNAQLNLDRYTALRQQNLIPQQQVDDQRASVEQLAAATKADQATMASARLNLEYARIASPIDGVTGVRLVDPGNIVRQTDTTGIVLVTQLDPIAVIFTLPQDVLPRIQKAMAAGKPSVVAFARDAETKLGQGQLEVIDNQVNAQTATVRLKAVMPNPDRALWPNAFVKARLHIETIPNALVVPSAAVQRGPQGTFVYVVAPDKTVSPKNVEVAQIQAEQAIIAKGLGSGDEVVTDGQNMLRPGAKVAPRAPDGAGPRKQP